MDDEVITATVAQAKCEAFAEGSSVVTTRHILLAILSQRESLATCCLVELGVHIDALVSTIKVQSCRSEQKPTQEQRLDKFAAWAIESARRHARSEGIRKVGIEHLLLGCVSHSGMLSATDLQIVGASMPSIRASIIKVRARRERSRKDNKQLKRRQPTARSWTTRTIVLALGVVVALWLAWANGRVISLPIPGQLLPFLLSATVILLAWFTTPLALFFRAMIPSIRNRFGLSVTEEELQALSTAAHRGTFYSNYMRARALRDLASLAYRLGFYSLATVNLRLAAVLYARMGRENLRLFCMLDLAHIEAVSGDGKRAVRYCANITRRLDASSPDKSLLVCFLSEASRICSIAGMLLESAAFFSHLLKQVTLDEHSAPDKIRLDAERYALLHLRFATLCMLVGRHDEAVTACNSAAQADPSNLDLQVLTASRKGAILFDANQLEEAADQFNEVADQFHLAFGVHRLVISGELASFLCYIGEYEFADTILNSVPETNDLKLRFINYASKMLAEVDRRNQLGLPSMQVVFSGRDYLEAVAGFGIEMERAPTMIALYSGVARRHLEKLDIAHQDLLRAHYLSVKLDQKDLRALSLMEVATIELHKSSLNSYIQLLYEAIQVAFAHATYHIGDAAQSSNSRVLQAAIADFLSACAHTGSSGKVLQAFTFSRGLALGECTRDVALMRLRNRLAARELRVRGPLSDMAADQFIPDAGAAIDIIGTRRKGPEVVAIRADELFCGFHVSTFETIHIGLSAETLTVNAIPTGSQSDPKRTNSGGVGWKERISILSSFDDRAMPISDWSAQGARWFETLIPESDRQRLLDASRLYLSPSSELWQVPFAALVLPDGKFLGIAKPIVYWCGLQKSMIEPAVTESDRYALVAAIGSFAEMAGESRNMQTEYGPLPNLIHATTEGLEIAKHYGTTPLLEEACTKAEFVRLAQRASIIHIATHAIYNDEVPMSSGIVFAGEDNILTAADVFDLDLSADVVVLSACRTGRGGQRTGEGMWGLAYAFLRAGVSTVVGSLWEVDDFSTSQLMLEFHRHLQSKGAAEAMRIAMATLHDQGYTPYHWAPFIIFQRPK